MQTYYPHMRTHSHTVRTHTQGSHFILEHGTQCNFITTQRFNTHSQRVFLCKFLVVQILVEGIHLQNHMIPEVEGGKNKIKQNSFITFLKPALDVQRQQTTWPRTQPGQGNFKGRFKRSVTQIGLQKNRSVYAVSLSTVLSKTSLTKQTVDIGDLQEVLQEATNTTQVHQGSPKNNQHVTVLIKQIFM